MDKKLLTVIGILGGLVLLYFINLGVQNSYSSDTTKIFSITEDSVSKIVISSNQDAIELIKNDTTWAISGNDTLTIKENVIATIITGTIAKPSKPSVKFTAFAEPTKINREINI